MKETNSHAPHPARKRADSQAYQQKAQLPRFHTALRKKLPACLAPLAAKNFCSPIGMPQVKEMQIGKINDNLEQQGQALFTHYFIENASSDWKKGYLSDLINVKYGKDHKKLADGKYHVYGSGGIIRYVERTLYNKESVLIPRKGTLNNVIYANHPFWSVDTMIYTEMKKANIAKFIYHFIKGKNLASMNAGLAVPSMTTDILNSIELAIPSEYILDKFENLVAPIYRIIHENNGQTNKLGKIRDSLLPRLMSGELDISNLNI